MKNKSIHHKAIQNFIWNKRGKPFEFHKFKVKIHKYGWYGGNRYKKWLKKTYGLSEFKKGRLVYLQKIPNKKLDAQHNSSNKIQIQK